MSQQTQPRPLSKKQNQCSAFADTFVQKYLSFIKTKRLLITFTVVLRAGILFFQTITTCTSNILYERNHPISIGVDLVDNNGL